LPELLASGGAEAGLLGAGDYAAGTAATQAALADAGIGTGIDAATAAGAGAGAGAADAAASPLSNLNLMPSDQAIKNAALKTGLSLASGQDPTKALESGALGLVGGVVGSNVSNLVSPTISCLVCQNKGLTTGISNTIGSTVGNMVTGASPTNALISGIGSGVSSGLGQNGANLLSSPLAGAAGAATSAALKGADPTQILTNAAIGAGSNYVGSQISGALKDLAGNPTAGQTGGIGTMNSSSLNPDNGSPDTTIPSGGLPSTTVASNDPLAGTGLTTDANGNLVFSNPSLTAAGPAGPMTAGLTNVPGSAPPMTDAELAAAAKTGQTIDLGTIGNLDNTDSQSTSGTDTSTNDNTDTSGDTGGLSLSIPTSSGSSGLSASEVQNIVAQQMAANPGLSEAQVKADIQSAMAANPGMTADQVNQIVQNNLSSLTGQVSGLQSGLSGLSGTVANNQAQTENQLSGMSAQEKSDVAALQQQGVSLQDAINQVSQQNQAGLNALSTQFTNQLNQSDQQTQQQFGQLTQEQQQQAAALTAQGASLTDAINQVAQENQSGLNALSSQFTNQLAQSDANTQAQFGQLSQEQQQQAQALAAQGTSLTDAINSVQAGLTSTIGDLSSTFDQKLAASDQATQDAFNGLSDAQKAQATQEAQDTGNLQQAIDNASATSQSNLEAATSGLTNTINTNQQATNEALASTNQNVANLSDQEKTDFGQLSGQQQSDFQNLSSAQADLAKSLTDMGTSFGDAIDQVKNLDEQGIATVQGQLDAYQQQTQAGLDTTNQNINDLSTQTQDEIAKAAEASAAANAATNSTIASNQASTSSALQGLGTGLTALQQAQQQAKAQSMMPTFSNAESVLKSYVPTLHGAKLVDLRQLYDSLDPDLKQAMGTSVQAPAAMKPEEVNYKDLIPPSDFNKEVPIMPTSKHGGLIHMAGAGSVSDAVDDLVSANTPTMQSVFNDAQKAFQPTPMRSPASTGLDSSTKYIQAAKLRQLQHLYDSITPALRGYLMGGPVVGMGGMAEGGLPARYHPEAPEGHHPEFITGQTGYYAAGRGTGQSDDIPAMLHDGDYVIDADSVAQLGDGSSKAGAQALEHFRNQIPHHAHGGSASPVPAKIADGEYVLPAAFVSALGGGDNKTGSKLLDKMREELREHKRSAPVNKIPPKAKSPLDYLRMAKG